MSPKIKWSHIIICSVISFHLAASYFISFGGMPVAGHRKVSAKFLQFIVDAKRQIWLTMKSMWQLKLFLFPNIMRFCDSGMGCNFPAFCDCGKEHSAILATRGKQKKVRNVRCFDFVHWIELRKLHPFHVTHWTNEFAVHSACETNQRVQQRNLRVHPTYVSNA